MIRMSKFMILLTICLFISLSYIYTPVLGAIGKPIAVGETLEEFRLSPPNSPKALEYLGLKNEEPFTLYRLGSKLILIEIFSTSCGTCIKSAPGMNKLFKFIQNEKDLNNDIKMIAIGQGDSAKRVDAWQKKFRVQFPLFPDPKREIFKKFGKPGTPYTVLVDCNGKVLYAHGGQIKDIEKFFNELKEFHKQQ